jgi:hypothetical protein
MDTEITPLSKKILTFLKAPTIVGIVAAPPPRGFPPSYLRVMVVSLNVRLYPCAFEAEFSL